MATDLPDPSDVHPEHDMPTPENMDDWSDEQLDTYREAKSAELEQQAQENTAEIAEEQRERIEKMRAATGADDADHTETVPLSDDLTLTVTTKMTGELEELFERIRQNPGDISQLKEDLLDAIVLLIEDDPEDEDDDFTYQDRAFWEAYYYEEGTEGLFQVFDQLADPVLTRWNELGNSDEPAPPSTSSK